MKNKFIHYPLVMALMLLFCVPCVTVTYAQSFTVTGTVTDSQGGIPGANVKVKGGTAGTITNMDGQFTLSVPSSKSILVVSYFSFNFGVYLAGNLRVDNLSVIIYSEFYISVCIISNTIYF